MSDYDPDDRGDEPRDNGRPPLAQPRNAVTVGNPFGVVPNDPPPGRVLTGLVSVEQQRAVAEIQARMIIARANPRDPMRCMDMILRDCTRPSLAEVAVYQYARGGTSISGPSIRLAEAIAQRWGNIASGVKEISRDQKEGISECIAYAFDTETGFYDERQFQVRHWRDTRKGGYRLTDERDIYELIANLGQRRKRAVLLTVIPGDVTEAAVNQCEETLQATADVSPEGIKRVVAAFAEFGVTQRQIEIRCQCRAEAIRPAQVIQLRKIFASLRDDMSAPGDWFAPDPADTGETIEQQRATVIRYANRAGIQIDPAKVHNLNPADIAPMIAAIQASDQGAFREAAQAYAPAAPTNGATRPPTAADRRRAAKAQAEATTGQDSPSGPRDDIPPNDGGEGNDDSAKNGIMDTRIGMTRDNIQRAAAQPDQRRANDEAVARTMMTEIGAADRPAQIDTLLRGTINATLLDRWEREWPEGRTQVMQAASTRKTALEASAGENDP